ncbi:MAG: hypothetical protein CMF48_01595 [Legionellales bacterium]|nr:hypothetical protein [Legionellales bacterium]|tara:strand:+ start:3073 stop:4314 length:1242 start_codon:yes stop_codon:yes gene_type:complete
MFSLRKDTETVHAKTLRELQENPSHETAWACAQAALQSADQENQLVQKLLVRLQTPKAYYVSNISSLAEHLMKVFGETNCKALQDAANAIQQVKPQIAQKLVQANLASRLADAQTDRSAVLDAKHQLRVLHKKLEAESNTHQNECASLNARIQHLMAMAQFSITVADENMNRLKAQRAVLEEQVSELARSQHKTTAELTSFKMKHESLSKQYQDLQACKTSLQEEHQLLTNQVQILEEQRLAEAHDFKTQIRDLENSILGQQDLRERSEDEVDRLHELLCHAEQGSAQQTKRFEARMNSARATLINKEKTIAELKHKYRGLLSEHLPLEEADQDNQFLRGQLKEAREINSQLSARLAALSSALETTSAEEEEVVLEGASALPYEAAAAAKEEKSSVAPSSKKKAAKKKKGKRR